MNKDKIAFGMLILLTILAPAHGRLGETMRACERRYGAHVNESAEAGKIVRTYRKGDFRIVAEFHTGKPRWFGRMRCNSIRYTKPSSVNAGANLPIGDEERNVLLTVNSDGQPWQEVNLFMEAARGASLEEQTRVLSHGEQFSQWRRRDGAVASHDRQNHVLLCRQTPERGGEGNGRTDTGSMDGF